MRDAEQLLAELVEQVEEDTRREDRTRAFQDALDTARAYLSDHGPAVSELIAAARRAARLLDARPRLSEDQLGTLGQLRLALRSFWVECPECGRGMLADIPTPVCAGCVKGGD